MSSSEEGPRGRARPLTAPRLVFATRNPGKLAELKAMTFGLLLDVFSVDELGLSAPKVVEDQTTYAGNAAKKAKAVAAALRLPALADDSGLEIPALGGEPGLRSARYAGDDATDDDNIRKVLNRLRLVGAQGDDRAARYHCALALADPAGRCFVREGACEGFITDAPRGIGGFGYDPIFLSTELGATFAEVSIGQKARVSHRAQAMRLMRETLVAYFRLAKGSGSK